MLPSQLIRDWYRAVYWTIWGIYKQFLGKLKQTLASQSRSPSATDLEQQLGEPAVELLFGIIAVERPAYLGLGDQPHVVKVPVEGLDLVNGTAAGPADPLRPRLGRGDPSTEALASAGQNFHDVVVVVLPVLVDVFVGEKFGSEINWWSVKYVCTLSASRRKYSGMVVQNWELFVFTEDQTGIDSFSGKRRG